MTLPDPVLAGCCGVEPLQEVPGLDRVRLLGEQHPCQYQVAGFAPVAQCVVDAEVLPRVSIAAPGSRSPWVNHNRACWAGTGLGLPAGPGDNRVASFMASAAPAGSPAAWRIQAKVARPAARGGL